jgi:hypothetical protein
MKEYEVPDSQCYRHGNDSVQTVNAHAWRQASCVVIKDSVKPAVVPQHDVCAS